MLQVIPTPSRPVKFNIVATLDAKRWIMVSFFKAAWKPVSLQPPIAIIVLQPVGKRALKVLRGSKRVKLPWGSDVKSEAGIKAMIAWSISAVKDLFGKVFV